MPQTRSIGTALLGLDADASGYRRAVTQVIGQTRRMQTGTTSLTKDVRSLGTASRFARERISAMGRSIGGSLGSLLNFRTAIATVAGGAGIGLLVKNSIAFGAELDRLSDRLDTSVGFIRELQFALGQVGGESDQAVDAIQELGQRVAEARVETGELFGAFEEIGRLDLLANITGAQSIEAQFEALRNAVSQIDDVNERLRIADGTFGEVGRTMLSLLPVYDDVTERADELGISLSEGQAAALAKVDTQLSTLGETFKVTFSRVVADNVGFITGVIELLTDAVVAAGKGVEALQSAVRTLTLPEGSREERTFGIQEEIRDTQIALREAIADRDRLQGQVNLNTIFGIVDPDLAAEYQEVKLEVEDYRKELERLQRALKNLESTYQSPVLIGRHPGVADSPASVAAQARAQENIRIAAARDFRRSEAGLGTLPTAPDANLNALESVIEREEKLREDAIDKRIEADEQAFLEEQRLLKDATLSREELNTLIVAGIEQRVQASQDAFLEEQRLLREATISTEEHYDRVFAAAERVAEAQSRSQENIRIANARDFRRGESAFGTSPTDPNVNLTALETTINKEEQLRERAIEKRIRDEERAFLEEQRLLAAATLSNEQFADLLTTNIETRQEKERRATEDHVREVSGYWQDYYRDQEQRLEELAERQEAFQDIFVDSFDSGFARAIEGAEKFGDAFVGIFRDIASELLRTQITRPFTEALVGGIGGFLGGFGGVPDLSGAFADGGFARAGGRYLVGERGPEIFAPNVSGTVIPNHAMGGGGQVVNINMVQNVYTDNNEILRIVGEATTHQINEALNRFVQVQSRPGELRRIPA